MAPWSEVWYSSVVMSGLFTQSGSCFVVCTCTLCVSQSFPTVCLPDLNRMCLVRLKEEGKDGRFMYRKLVEIMWQDVAERMKVMGVSTYELGHGLILS